MEPGAIISFHIPQLQISHKNQNIVATSHHKSGKYFNFKNFKIYPLSQFEENSLCKNILGKFPMFSLSRKNEYQIARLICAVVTLWSLPSS